MEIDRVRHKERPSCDREALGDRETNRERERHRERVREKGVVRSETNRKKCEGKKLKEQKQDNV